MEEIVELHGWKLSPDFIHTLWIKLCTSSPPADLFEILWENSRSRTSNTQLFDHHPVNNTHVIIHIVDNYCGIFFTRSALYSQTKSCEILVDNYKNLGITRNSCALFPAKNWGVGPSQ
ncbi:hypothetical protein CDBH8_0030 [Corynebacterium diphtheriae BH8]|nr:hypothetical protein CDBH8_0030 [Corynebacterium diphtheriae BH8]APM36453.1 hypothetical protein BS112_08185 [Corynebacterium diphtheriae]OLN19130.1 hypothetical protein BUE67_11195 [Corynebacterium diphtheriae]OLO13492.1 hypothetical protein BUV99_11410 [Corynebacterium diphtheriae]OLO21021.1 hypothetical protein BVH76_11545 [Corynebacterium diphtheriae]